MSAVSFHTGAMKANLLGAAALFVGAFALVSCAEQSVIPASPTYTPAPRPASGLGPTPLPVPPAATSWADLPATPGDWRWSMEGGQSIARFAGGRLVMRCDPSARAVRVERSDPDARIAGAAMLTIRTQTQSRTLNAVPQAGALVASLNARDPLLDAMAFSRGRFAVETPGLPPLYIPSWTEVSRVIEDCR